MHKRSMTRCAAMALLTLTLAAPTGAGASFQGPTRPMTVDLEAFQKAEAFPLKSSSGTFEHTFDLAAIKSDLTQTLADTLAARRRSQPRAAFNASSLTIPAIGPSALVVVAFLQDADKSVLQAVLTELARTTASQCMEQSDERAHSSGQMPDSLA